ncbi:histone acetyltransferase [Denitrobacterium detoxificans]|uniref:tRNA carboxymethyluridine synthase n=1 Tax=Denitrobacterium detoxificans TaxID=79604 RepID=A0A172RXV1_9ACTN|nr:elongator complex protein 3 [Denitrobacterium detoxificans]ANE22551.1 histone acetyltransferase [Denitrobacterium detoxificans]SEP00149.1 elongator complex protein 3 [Denitrobacterium detoxificans]
MEELFTEILALLRTTGSLEQKPLDALLRSFNARTHEQSRTYAKKKILPYYLGVKNTQPALWESWHVTPQEETALFAALRMKPRRSASGVATITVITKPWTCGSDCIYCPNDIRMPKSYLHAEPACQRAERAYFDPYLQVGARLRALVQMGHATDKVELIVLGGTFTDYPSEYQTWFIKEAFRALNEHAIEIEAWESRRSAYQNAGIARDDDELAAQTQEAQASINARQTSFNEAATQLYKKGANWQSVASWQTATYQELEREHVRNETAKHRVVGLVVETRPDAITTDSLRKLRAYGCTKVQIGVQSLQPGILKTNNRNLTPSSIARAFDLLRLFGFKIHAHFMVNLVGATPEGDINDYRSFVSDAPYQPDEVKLYPTALIAGARLEQLYLEGAWKPYDEKTLVNVLAQDVVNTPPFVRISRMIRDFSSNDIMAGNKKTNLRQMVENELQDRNAEVREIRYREIAGSDIDPKKLMLDEYRYETNATSERFLQWTLPDGRIAGFLRLSLPRESAFETYRNDDLPTHPNEAMIREVHVYGNAAHISGHDGTAQHLGLGKKLIEEACRIAAAEGYDRINVISAIGTREYYRKRGFADNGLYQRKTL